MSYPYIIQGNNVVVVIDNKPHTISKTHITYQKVVDAIKAEDWETVKNVIEPKQVVLDFGMGFVKIKGETLYWQGKEMHNAIADRMIQMLKDGFSIKPLVFFMENLMENPSYRSVQELYGFLEKNNLPITPDGHFLAYKKVRDDFKDIHSGTMDNSPGTIVSMPRNEVDDEANNTCSSGLHFCSQEYLPHFGRGTGDRVVIVKINPRDVVSIPTDYNNAKGRACRYEVISELGVDPSKAFDKAVQTTATGHTVHSAAPKSGDTPFKHGYHDGFHNGPYATGYYYKDASDYSDGYNKGVTDRNLGRTERYVYTPANAPAAPWPQPKGF